MTKKGQDVHESRGPHAQFVHLMKSCGVSNRVLADRVQVDPHTVSRWRTGKVEVPHAVIVYLELLLAVRRAGA